MPLRTKYDAPTAAISTANLAIGLLVSYFAGTGIFKAIRPAALISTLVTYALFLIFYSYILKGYQWARILFVAFFVISISFLLFYFKKTVSINMSTPLNTVGYITQWILGAIATVFAVLGIKEYTKLTRNKA